MPQEDLMPGRRDLFEKCRGFYADPKIALTVGWPTSPRMARALDLYPYFIPIEEAEGTEVVVEGRRLIMIGSNNYLGLTDHPRVREAAREAIRRFGTSCTGSRFLNGTLPLHLELEARLARFVGKPSALVFSTGFQTNLGTIAALIGDDDAVITDREVHASIVDGVRMARVRKDVQVGHFRHNDAADLADILGSIPAGRAALVIVDGVFSMGGDIAPLPEIAALCRAHGARLMVDDAHALGVLGGGRGTGFHFGCQDSVDLVMGTFSKSLASLGGFIAGPREVIHWIQHFARPFMFSASLPPANLAAAQAALDVIEEEPERIQRVNDIAARMRRELTAMGYKTGNSETPIIPILVGDQFKTIQAWRALFREGIYTNVALPPAVPPDGALLRTSYMATHTDEQLQRILDVFLKLRPRIIPPQG
jgi:8-amino-7-oxononanoate synthase